MRLRVQVDEHVFNASMSFFPSSSVASATVSDTPRISLGFKIQSDSDPNGSVPNGRVRNGRVPK